MKNHLRALYCNQCGKRLDDARAPKDNDGRAKLYADIAHPINSHCREMIQDCVIRDYYEEIERAKQPGYVSRYDDFDFEYSEPPRRGPTRFDQPHAYPTDQSHITTKSPPKEKRNAPPQVRSNAAADRSGTSRGSSDMNEGFGAGIFPG
jgi:stage V sporulation protein G